jgi:3-methyl-2-oxobutanoate hydroxymethyltransferase
VLVFHDVLGLLSTPSAKFVRKYLDGFAVCTESLGKWASDVRSGAFPGPAESYTLPEAVRSAVQQWNPHP